MQIEGAGEDLTSEDVMSDGVEIADETDAGPGLGRREPTRFCVATRTAKPVDQLLRFVVAPDGTVVPDLGAKLPGRGAWVSVSKDALATAIKKKAFGRAFRGKGKADAALAALVESLLEKDALAALGIANKAGRVVAGNTKVIDALQKGEATILLHSVEAARDGHAAAVLAASIFHFGEISIGEAKQAMADAGIPVRLDRSAA